MASPDVESSTLTPADYLTSFNPDAYLQHYFSKDSIEDGTRVSLFALPVFAHLMKQSMAPEERQTLLDVGAGPTVYTALCFRDVVNEVYLSDYVEKNLEILNEWVTQKGNIIDWFPTLRVIKRTEGGPPFTDKELSECENAARKLVKAGGILFANVHENPTVPMLRNMQVDILVTIFTLESACRTYEQYVESLGNTVAHLRSGGRLVLGSVLEDDSYNSGKQVIFHLLNLTEENILNALEAVGMNLESIKKYVLQDEGVMFLMITKL
ncbi:unnamed protein product [Auanema sp. JU1783]|nr:unnamed protein product [Auanema sp. JU1783]